MAKVLVNIVRKTIVEHAFAKAVAVDDDVLRKMTERPLQAVFWAKNILPYETSATDWQPLNDGRPSVSYDVIHIEILPQES